MGVIFTHGFETQQSLAGVALEFGRLGGLCDIMETSSIVGSGRRYLYIDAGSTHSSWADRGLGYELDFDGDEIWFGSYVQVLSHLRTRIFTVCAGVSKWLRLQVVVNPTDASSSIGFNHQPALDNTTTWHGTAMDVNSDPDWKFATEDNWDDENNAWRFVSVRIVRRDNDGDAFLYVDNFKRVELLNSAALGKHQGNITEISLAGFANTATVGRYVRHDDFWVSTTQLNEFRVFPTTVGELGSYDQAIPSIEDATPQDLISDYPSDLSTFLSIGEGDAISFKLDDSVIEDENATGVSDLKLELYVGGPAEYQVFVKDGASEESLGDFFVGGIAPQSIRIDLTENPITQAPWTREDLANIEIGVRNTVGGGGGPGGGGGGFVVVESADVFAHPNYVSASGTSFEYGMFYELLAGSDPITVTGLRVLALTEETTDLHLWDESGTLLRSGEVTALAQEWTSVSVDPLEVVAGTTLCVSGSLTLDTYRLNVPTTPAEWLAEDTGFVATRYASTRGAFPNTNLSNRWYPYDIVRG